MMMDKVKSNTPSPISSGVASLESIFTAEVMSVYADEPQNKTETAYTGIESVVRSRVRDLIISVYFLDGLNSSLHGNALSRQVQPHKPY